MKDMTVGMIVAVLEEIFGHTLFWVMVAVAAVITLAYLYVLIRDRQVSWKKFLLAQLAMPVGAIGAVWFVQAVTRSGFGDIGGPVDVIVLLGVAAMGAIGIAILVYTVQSLVSRPAAR